MTVRYFFFWCERCPTRITVETEVSALALDGEPEYAFAESEGVGLVRAAWRTALADVRAQLVDVRFHHATPARLEESLTTLDRVLRALENRVADLCPACGAQLHDLDDLLARGIVPYHENHESSNLHAAWRRQVSKP